MKDLSLQCAQMYIGSASASATIHDSHKDSAHTFDESETEKGYIKPRMLGKPIAVGV